MIRLAIICGLIGCFSWSCVSPREHCLAGIIDQQGQCQPHRKGFIMLNHDKDAQKPVAPISYGGYTIVGDTLVSATHDQWLGGYSLRSSHYTWWLKIDAPVASPITAVGDFVMVGLRDGKLLKVEAQTGKLVWQAEPGRFTSRYMVLDRNTLLMHATNDDVFGIAFDTGKTLWISEGQPPKGLAIRGSARPLVTQEHIYVAGSEGEIRMLDRRSGSLLKVNSLKGSQGKYVEVMDRMALVNDHLIIARYDGVVAAFDRSLTKPLWENQYGAIAAAEFRSNLLLLGMVSGEVVAVDSRSGEERWSLQTDQTVITLLAGEKVVYALGANGRVSALSLQQGQLQWLDDLTGTVYRQPALFGDVMYVGTGLGALYGYKIR